jgi:hypothetical protein
MTEFRYNTKHTCGQRLSLTSPIEKHGIAVTCPSCNKRAYLERVKGTYNPDHKCDPRCTGAHGNTCTCACGGANHGADHGIQHVVAVTERSAVVDTPRGHLGEIGERFTANVRLNRVKRLANGRYLFQFRTGNDDRITWFVPEQYAPMWEEGWKGTISAKVKAHEDDPQWGKATIVLYVEAVDA